MLWRSAYTLAALFVSSSMAFAMCGGGMKGSPSQGSTRAQCGGGSMSGMKMDGTSSKPDAAEKKDGAADPHAGMDMGSNKGEDGMKMEGMGGCCCCGGQKGGPGGGQGGGMCGGKQAALNPDGSNDPLLSDPMWTRPKSKPAPQNQTPMP